MFSSEEVTALPELTSMGESEKFISNEESIVRTNFVGNEKKKRIRTAGSRRFFGTDCLNEEHFNQWRNPHIPNVLLCILQVRAAAG